MNKPKTPSENISRGQINKSQMDEVYPKNAGEFSTIFYQKSSEMIKLEEILMSLILPTVSSRLTSQSEIRKLKKSD